MKAAINFQSHSTSNVANVAQAAALAAVSGDLSAVAMMRDAFERRGKTMHRMLSEIDGVTCLEPQGAFYCYPNVKSLLGRPLNGHVAHTTMELADLVLERGQGGVRARRGVRHARATPASRSPSATTTWPRGSPVSPVSPPADPRNPAGTSPQSG